jgi:hypothetical protein
LKYVRVYFGPVLLYVRNNIALLEGFKVSSFYPVSESISEIKMSFEHWWKNNEKRNLKYSKENIPKYQFAVPKYHKVCHRTAAGPVPSETFISCT